MSLAQKPKWRACADCRRKKIRCVHQDSSGGTSRNTDIDSSFTKEGVDDQSESKGQLNSKRKAVSTDEIRSALRHRAAPSNDLFDPNDSDDDNSDNSPMNIPDSNDLHNDSENPYAVGQRDTNQTTGRVTAQEGIRKAGEWKKKAIQGIEEQERAMNQMWIDKDRVEKENRHLGEQLRQAAEDREQARKDGEDKEADLRNQLTEMQAQRQEERERWCKEASEIKGQLAQKDFLLEKYQEWLQHVPSETGEFLEPSHLTMADSTDCGTDPNFPGANVRSIQGDLIKVQLAEQSFSKFLIIWSHMKSGCQGCSIEQLKRDETCHYFTGEGRYLLRS